MPPFMDVTGQRFGYLTVLRRAANDRQRLVRWECRCDCGETTTQRGSSLRGGVVVSCGCIRTQLATARIIAATRKAIPGYRAAHGRIFRARGRADAAPCVDCGARADDWSLRRDAASRHVQRGGQADGLPYSLDPDDYEPRCTPCHTRYDSR